jgi:adenylate cyclase
MLQLLYKYRLRRALIATCVILAVIGGLVVFTRVFDSIDRVVFDWRSAILADQARGTYPNIVLVEIGEESISGPMCRSPIDRSLLAEVISAIGGQSPRVIGIDFLLDRPTNAAADEALRESMKAAPVVLPIYRPDKGDIRGYNSYALKLADALHKPVGYLNLRREVDGVIRRPFEVPSNDITNRTFAERIAEVGEWTVRPARRIAWLRPPEDGGDTFHTLRASDVLSLSKDNPELLRSQIAGKAVLIGSALSGLADRHATPLSTLYANRNREIDEDPTEMSGLEVNAQMLAQLIDGRDYSILAPKWVAALTVLATFFGVFYGWFFQNTKFPTGPIPWLCFLILDAIVFSTARIEIPFLIPAAAWQVGSFFGQWRMGGRDAT